MLKIILYSLIMTSTILFISCNSNEIKKVDTDGLSAFNKDSLAKHIQVLSSNEFQGRKPFTEGETKTIAYLTEQFRAVGVEPGNGNSYVQEVPMVKITTQAAPQMEVQAAKEKFTLKGFDDYAIWTDKTDSAISLKNDEVVFAGYGVVAPEYNWNDYAGLDVKGKVVMVLVNDPGFNAGDSTLFKGKTMTYYGRWTYKFEEAGRQGAKGCLIVHNTEAASYPFSVVQNNWNTSRFRLDNRGKKESLCDVIGWISNPTAKKLLRAAGQDTTLLSKADTRGFKAVPLDLKLSTTMKVKADYNKSYNVVGKITGTKRPDEVIIYTAHWDHLGIGTPDDKGDSIYNGALDNASGTAGLIEFARAFKSLKTAPERTIVLLAVTAEEQGLLGSAYYAQNPIFPPAKTVADINIDVLNSYGATKDIVVVGQGQNELEDYLNEEVKKVDRQVVFEPHPEAGYYYRSDHFNFAKAGIPALYIESGENIIGKDPEYGKSKVNEYREKNYHRPSDEYNAGVVLEGAIEDLKLLFNVGKRLAFTDAFPKWKPGSEFKALREKQ